MKKNVSVTIEKEVLFCDSCGCQLCFKDESHQSVIELSFKGTGYTMYGGTCDTEWDYQLCRKCATSLKDYLDGGKNNLQNLPESEE